MEWWSNGLTYPPSLCSGQVLSVKENNKKTSFSLLPSTDEKQYHTKISEVHPL